MDRIAAFDQWRGFISHCEAETSRPAGPVQFINAGSGEEWFRHVHGLTGSVAELGLRLLDNVTVSGDGLLFLSGGLFPDTSEFGLIARQHAEATGLSSAQLIRRERQVVPLDPVLVFLGPAYHMWGHWLLDYLPRLGLARAVLDNALDNFVIPIPSDTPEFAVELIEKFIGIDRARLLRFDQNRESLLCRRLALPSYTRSGDFLHSFVRKFYESINKPTGPKLPTRLFVSRRIYQRGIRFDPHRIANEVYFERCAERMGFTVIEPERLPILEQVALFSGAKAIVGGCGSGMHNAIFARPGTLVAQVGMPNARQSRIAALCEHRMIYLLPDGPAADPQSVGGITVSTDMLDTFFETVARELDAGI